MGKAKATIERGRIVVRTYITGDFEEMLFASKRVNGGRFKDYNGDKFWHYPLSLDTCHALRRAFKDKLVVGGDLAQWYRSQSAEAQAQRALAAELDAELKQVEEGFAGWLRGYQRAGAAWIARGYRGAGLVADKPGVGKTPQMLAAMIERGLRGPVLVVCPKSSVRLVWGREIGKHLPRVPTYLCKGSRRQREKVLARFAKDVRRNPNKLRVVVIVAEMLRVELGPPCVQKDSGRRVAGMCQRGPAHRNHEPADVDKKKFVPVGFSFPELFDAELLRGGWSSIVLDESHKLLGSLTIVKGNLMGKGLKLLPERDKARYAISGTPFGKGGRVQGMFGTLNWLWPDEYTSFWKWVGEWFEVEEKVINRFGKTVKEIKGLKGLGPKATAIEEEEAWEAFLATLGPRILRRTKEEVMKELEPKSYAEVLCEMTPKQAKQNKELIDWAEVKTPRGVVAANGTLALLTRSRQIANGEITKDPNGKVTFTGNESGKLERLWANLDTRGILDAAPGDKIIIASQYNEFLDVIADKLKNDSVQYFQYDGRVTQAHREWIVDRWQDTDDPCDERVLLLQTKAGGESITLDAADEMHIMDEDSDPGVMEQLEDRIHRASRIHKVFIYNYRTEGSVDHKRAHDVEFRRRVQHAVLDGSRGVKYTRQMIADAFADREMED